MILNMRMWWTDLLLYVSNARSKNMCSSSLKQRISILEGRIDLDLTKDIEISSNFVFEFLLSI